MTKEETKKRFQSWCQGYIGNNASDEDYQMFNNIMALLEQEPKTDYISIDDVMSVFDDFMCGEVDEEGTETFLEMLKDKAESEGY